MNYYAHSAEDGKGRQLPEQHWQPLPDHLRNVAKLAKQFAEPPGHGPEAELAGLLYDRGRIFDHFLGSLISTVASARCESERRPFSRFNGFISRRQKPLKRFICHYATPRRAKATVLMRGAAGCEVENQKLSTMLRMVFDQPQNRMN